MLVNKGQEGCMPLLRGWQFFWRGCGRELLKVSLDGNKVLTAHAYERSQLDRSHLVADYGLQLLRCLS